MRYEAQSTAGDFISFSLYSASVSPVNASARRRNRLFLTMTVLLIAYLNYNANNQWVTWLLLVIAAVCWITFPAFSRWFYESYYRKYVNRTYKQAFGKTIVISLEENKLVVAHDEDVTEVSWADVDEIAEIPTHYFLRTSGGQSLLVPKTITSREVFDRELKTIAERFSISYIDDTNWVWR